MSLKTIFYNHVHDFSTFLSPFTWLPLQTTTKHIKNKIKPKRKQKELKRAHLPWKLLHLPNFFIFSFVDKYDWFLMILGSLGTIVHGSFMFVFFLLFDEMVNGFRKNQFNFHKVTSEVSKVLKFIPISLFYYACLL